MMLAVLASDLQKEEIAHSAFFGKHEVLFSENISLWSNHIADAFIDCCFEPSKERIDKLSKLLPKPVLVHSVTDTLQEIHPEFIRINGWPGFLKGNCLEAAAEEKQQQKAITVFGEQILFVKDEPGFISARIVAMIINEAYFTWEAGTSTKEEIDIAMKLGTGYPYGPFEWGEMIGLEHIAGLLSILSKENEMYELAKTLLRHPSSVNRHP
jgi:3-hydroxybutyryl-CoA dehydrogenase